MSKRTAQRYAICRVAPHRTVSGGRGSTCLYRCDSTRSGLGATRVPVELCFGARLGARGECNGTGIANPAARRLACGESSACSGALVGGWSNFWGVGFTSNASTAAEPAGVSPPAVVGSDVAGGGSVGASSACSGVVNGSERAGAGTRAGAGAGAGEAWAPATLSGTAGAVGVTAASSLGASPSCAVSSPPPPSTLLIVGGGDGRAASTSLLSTSLRAVPCPPSPSSVMSGCGIGTSMKWVDGVAPAGSCRATALTRTHTVSALRLRAMRTWCIACPPLQPGCLPRATIAASR